MKDSSLGIPVRSGVDFWYPGEHSPGTIEVTTPHGLLKALDGMGEYQETRRQVVTVQAYDNEGQRVGWHHVTQLPGHLGNTATQLIASAWVTRFAIKV